MVRTTLDPVSLLPLMRQTLRDLDAELPVLRARTRRQHVASALGQPRAAGAFLGGSAPSVAPIGAWHLLDVEGH